MSKQIWLVGQGALARPDGAAVLSAVAKAAASTGALVDAWNGFSVLHTAAARVGGLDIGFVPGQGALSARQMFSSRVRVVKMQIPSKSSKCFRPRSPATCSR